MTEQHAVRPIEVHWLVRLRWAAIGAQIASILGVKYVLHAPFPLVPLVVIVALLALANLLLARRLRRGALLGETGVVLNLLLDVVALTGLLVWTGGAMNPFTTLYLLHVALACVLLPRNKSVIVAVGAALAFGGLLLARPEAIHVWHSGSMFMLHVRGMWLAFVLTAGTLWFFVDRVSTALRRREAELAEARVEAARAERLASVGTLAAGAAHELNTPLGTVAILAAELCDVLASDATNREYAEKIRAEVARCADVLARMRPREGSTEAPRRVEFDTWVGATVEAWCSRREGASVPVRVGDDARGTSVAIPVEAMRRALGNVLDNAARAVGNADGATWVEVTRPAEGWLTLRVFDRGPGVPEEHLGRLGEPFFTTRQPGEGMGLGLFLVRETLAQCGGTFSARSGGGETCVELRLPVARGGE